MVRAGELAVALSGRLSATILALVAASVLLDVVLRYVFNAPTLWSVEFTAYGVAWIALLGAGDVLAADEHVRVGLLVDRLPERGRVAVRRLGDAIVLAVALILTVASARWAYNSYAIGEISDTVLQTPQALIRAAFPVGMSAVALAAALRLAGFGEDGEGEGRWSS
jgi:TRAP-type C4-dicarboxylate transport system permease small subunit